MLFINHRDPNEWWEWNQETMRAISYRGGFHEVDENSLGGVECYECNNWHELYLAKHFCPLEVEIWERNVWISPDGKYYDGDAHEVAAKDILEIVYGEDSDFWEGDKLEARGWIRATTSMMWDVRFDEWSEKRLTQKQYDALWDWCQFHKMKFPNDVEVL